MTHLRNGFASPSELLLSMKKKYEYYSLCTRLLEYAWTLTVGSALTVKLSAIVWSLCQVLQPEDAEKTLESVLPAMYSLNPCPSWLIRESLGGLAGQVNFSLWEGVFPVPTLKRWCGWTLLKRPSLDLEVLNSCRPIPIILFLEKGR